MPDSSSQPSERVPLVPRPAAWPAARAIGILKLTGAILTATGSYATLFLIAGCAYLVALAAMHALVTRLAPAKF